MLRDQFDCSANSDEKVSVSSGGLKRPVVTRLLCGNSLLQAGLTQLLAGSRFAVADISRNVDASLSGQEGTVPALYVVDASGSSQRTLGFVQDAKGQHPTARIVAVANNFDLGLIQLAVTAGADSFCLATGGREVLINILELTMLGEQVLPGTVLQSFLNQAQTTSGAGQTPSASEQNKLDPRVHKLSPRETVILQSLMSGEANKIIAKKLDITEATIKVHVKSILRKIGAANRTQAAMWANENLRTTERISLNNG